MKKLVIVSLVVLMAVLPAACTAPAAPQAAPTTIKIGVNIGNIPWEFNEGSQLTGFEIDMLNEICKRMNAKPEYVNVPFSGIFAGLLSSKWDIAASSIFIKKERAAQMDFADPYYDSDISLMVRKDSTMKAFEDMKGKTFGADTGTVNDAWLKDNVSKYGPYQIKGYDRPTDAFLDLEAGRLDGVVGDAPTTLYYAKDKPTLDVRFMMGSAFKQAVAFRKGDALRDKYNTVQNDLKKDGTLAKIYKKWFGKDPAPDSSTVKVYTTPYVPQQ